MATAMRQSNIRHGHAVNGLRGFTLIEVMVVLALTLIMMAAFAQIFSMTGTFVTKQKGIGENDQAARILTTVLKADLQSRTMRFVAPLHPNMAALTDDPSRQGYFEYSENNPLDDTDDVLQFTIALPSGLPGKPLVNATTGLPLPPLYGTATFLPKQSWLANTAYATGAYVIPQAGGQTGFIYYASTGGTSGGPAAPAWPATLGTTVTDGTVVWTCADSTLQPDGDDGILFPLGAPPASPNTVMLPQSMPTTLPPSPYMPATNPPTAYTTNNTGASPYAEVTYFLRHGNLYRRVLLIRQPYNAGGSTQPGTNGFPMINGAYNGTFWADFDYSARFDNVTAFNGPRFFDQTDLNNAPSATYNANTFPIGSPANRFGHDQTNGAGTLGPSIGAGGWPVLGQTGNGAPREYDINGVFLGRYSDEETSNPAFQFPGSIPAAGSPMGQATTANIGANGAVNEYTGPPVGTRRGEDILLTNVISFDVKIWDSHYSESIATGDVNRNGIIDTGPAFADVGHSAVTGDFLASNNLLPTYGPHASLVQTPATASPNMFTYTNGAGNTVTFFNNVFDTWFRTFNYDNVQRTYDSQVVDTSTTSAPAPYRPRVGAVWQPTHAYTAGALVDAPPIPAINANSSPNGLVYQCAIPGGGGVSGATNPFTLTDTGTVTDGTVTWTVLPPVALQAIQITVKYLDPTQNLLRQVTIVQSLAP
jgi:prepilin-type N-terminal cleavage/methylation domain-containing protein